MNYSTILFFFFVAFSSMQLISAEDNPLRVNDDDFQNNSTNIIRIDDNVNKTIDDNSRRNSTNTTANDTTIVATNVSTNDDKSKNIPLTLNSGNKIVPKFLISLSLLFFAIY